MVNRRILDKSNMDLIVVGIDCIEGLKRLDEYGPWQSSAMGNVFDESRTSVGGEGKDYIDYIVNDLKPRLIIHTSPIQKSPGGAHWAD
ncbi:hypothetical protein LS684_21580 (plasmid) [Cytobacillus spongiae]|uniref:hypothetical protein n=1 Tax=Cytobacillus spongiae TaxID=2901381 RepID=UPI001F2EC9A6|nr:hypothetical protein [Cytobacillus spongiae]UII58210.1 hypothetical protein LS684_21580 [Cytobacillus spongiae]